MKAAAPAPVAVGGVGHPYPCGVQNGPESFEKALSVDNRTYGLRDNIPCIADPMFSRCGCLSTGTLVMNGTGRTLLDFTGPAPYF